MSPYARPLPPALAGRPFAVTEARSLGVGASRLRARDLAAPTRGVRVLRSSSPDPAPGESGPHRLDRLRAELVERAALFAPALTAGQFFSHDTALALVGAPLPPAAGPAHPLHVSARRPAAMPRRQGVVGHRLQHRAPARWQADGLPIEHPARALRQVAATWSLDELIRAGDHLVSPRRRLLALDELHAELAEAGDVRGGLLGRALAEIRVGAESPGETDVRLLAVRASLPEPQLNWVLTTVDGRFVARFDLAWPEYAVAAEYDGRVHAFDDTQFARDADRWDDIRAQGWRHVRILSHHLRPDPRVALQKMSDALVAAGWRPGRS